MHRRGSLLSVCVVILLGSLMTGSVNAEQVNPVSAQGRFEDSANSVQILLPQEFTLDPGLSSDLARLSETEENGQPPEAPTPGIDVPWDSILGRAIQFAVSIFGGPSPYSRNAGAEFAPASTAKLFTSALALEKLGPNFQFETRLKWRVVAPGVATGLTMIGSGDPTWGVVDLVSSRKPTDDLVGMLVDRGIHTVQGPISLVAADPRWDSYRAPVGWNGGTCSYSPALAFTIYRNCAGNRPVTDSRPIARQLLMASLQAAHIRIVSGPTSSGGTEDSAVYLSQPLSHILVPFLKHSINVVGEALLRTVGQKSETARNMDLLEAGQDEMREFVGRIGARTAGKVRVKVEPRYFSGRVTLYDGSGLSREDRVTGDAMIALLKDISNAPYFKYIWDALPIAGVDGTLKARMKGTAAQNLLRAKTGTISGVYNLAGYVPRMVNGRIAQLVPFVILTKDAKSKTAAHLIEDRLGRALAEAVLQTTIGPVR